MKNSLLNRSRLAKFLAFSLILHVAGAVVQELTPESAKVSSDRPPIKVTYVPPNKTKPDSLKGSIIDAPKPKKIEKPKTSDLLASFDSRAHSKRKKTTVKKYQRRKTVIPKSRGTGKKNKKAKTLSRKKASVSKVKTVFPERKKSLPISEKGKFKKRSEEKQPETKSAQSAGAGSALAFLDGFDAEKYASFDTEPEAQEDWDDGETISLDTTEAKYASYFARIKHQIERVWSYPIDAAQRGISGEVTLRFRISRDGNLLDVRMVDKSGKEILDYAALKAVKDAAPFYPFPFTIEKKKLAILATFIYSPTYTTLPSRR